MTVGCPPKYTPERLKGILNSISLRIPYELAAEANGIRESTLYAWINQGKNEKDQELDTPLAKFSEDIKKLEQKRMATHLKKIRANVKNWQADAWILERRWSKYFSSNALLKEQEERLSKLEEAAKQKE